MAGPPLRAALTGEFLGTALLVLLGDGVVAGDVLLNKTSDKMMVTTAWGLAVALVVATAVLLLGVRALTDRRNAAPGGYVEPLALGALVWAIGLSLGGLTGYAINPARDLGPRLASAFLGWGTAVFWSHGGYFWIPIVAPLAGGLAGIFLYDFAIHRHLPPEGEPSPPGELSP